MRNLSFVLFVRIVFWSAWDQRGQKGRYLAKNVNFGPNLAVFGPNIHFLVRWSKTSVSSYQGTNETPFPCWTLTGAAARDKNVFFWPKNLDIWSEKSIFCIVIRIFVDSAYHQYTRGYNFPIRTTPKKISISELWVIFQGSPLFLTVSVLCHFTIISTLNFGPFSMKLGGNVWATKKMTQNDNRPCPDRNYRETAVFTFSRKLFFFFGEKCILSQKNTQNFLRD